jgi:ATP-dependent protease ClpP protease subunit
MKTIQVKGPIVSDSEAFWYNWLGIPSSSPAAVLLPEDGEDVTVEINSNGGSVSAGAEIYTKLRAYDGKVNVNVVGMAASAASVIAMAGDHVAISPMAQMMIHNASADTFGNADAHKYIAGVLDDVSEQIAESYAARSGKSVDDFKDLMSKETYLTAKQAVEVGLADEVMFDDTEEDLGLTASIGGMLSPETIEKLRNTMAQAQQPTPIQSAAGISVLNKDDVANMISDAIDPLAKQITGLTKLVTPKAQKPEPKPVKKPFFM